MKVSKPQSLLWHKPTFFMKTAWTGSGKPWEQSSAHCETATAASIVDGERELHSHFH